MISRGRNMSVGSYGGFEIELTNQEKVLFPRDGYTKKDLVEYYSRISPFMLPHSRGRPVSMVRYPDGIDGESFFQKEAPGYFPDWLRRVRVKKKDGTVDHIICEKEADLVFLANLACITPHIWLSTEVALERPDRLILDLDPSDDDFPSVRAAAIGIRDILERLDMEAYVMTTGSRGLHIVVPLDRTAGFDETRALAKAIAAKMATHDPARYTTEGPKEKRGKRLLIDTFRNAYGQTGVAPYAVRARDGAPVAAPISWAEVEDGDIGPRHFNIKNMFSRLSSRGDMWNRMDDRSFSVASARTKLKDLGTL